MSLHSSPFSTGTPSYDYDAFADVHSHAPKKSYIGLIIDKPLIKVNDNWAASGLRGLLFASGHWWLGVAPIRTLLSSERTFGWWVARVTDASAG